MDTSFTNMQAFALLMSAAMIGFIALSMIAWLFVFVMRGTIIAFGYAAMPLAYVAEHAHRALCPCNRRRLTWPDAVRRYRQDVRRLTDPLERVLYRWD